MEGEKAVNKLVEGKPRGEEKNRKTYIQVGG
jgi:hypothetical protein